MAQKEQERQEKLAMKAQGNVDYGSMGNRSINVMELLEQQECAFVPDALKKGIETFEPSATHKSCFYSTYSPDVIEDIFIKYLIDEKIEFTASDNKYKLKFTQRGKDSEGEDYEIFMVLRILKVDDSKVCVELQRTFPKDAKQEITKANSVLFQEYYKTYTTSVFNVFDDVSSKAK